MYDYIIQNATVYTGLNESPKHIDVAILDNKIKLISTTEEVEAKAKKIIDAKGYLLTPGFIDPHASTGFGYFFADAVSHKLHQGITTEVFGNCGVSPAPVGEHLVDSMKSLSAEVGFPFSWRSLEEYFEKIQDKLQFNIATLIGHNTLRIGNMTDWGNLKAAQLLSMKQSLKFSMQEGALGLSTALVEPPGCFADIQEVVELAKIVAAKGGVYAAHIRNEKNDVEEAVEEALLVSKAAKVRALLSHFKIAEEKNWGKIGKVLNMLEQFNEENPTIPIAIDVYPYTAMTNQLRGFVPKGYCDDEKVDIDALFDKQALQSVEKHIEQHKYDLSKMLVISEEIAAFFGKTMKEIQIENDWTAAETMAEVLSKNIGTWIAYHSISQADVDKAILWKRAMVCTDSWSYPVNIESNISEEPHPRSYGAFTTFLENYVVKDKKLTWQEAIYKITALPATFFGLEGRGQIKDGYYADLVLINPKSLKTNATYLEPKKLSDGVEYLWVNGTVVIEDKKINKSLAGKVLTLKRESVSPLAH